MRTTLFAPIAIVIAAVLTPTVGGLLEANQEGDKALREQARASLRKAVEFYRTKVATHGGYHFAYAEDLSYGRSEMSEGPTRVEIQRDGTPLVALAYLDAYAATGDAYYLESARDVARALVKGQFELQRRIRDHALCRAHLGVGLRRDRTRQLARSSAYFKPSFLPAASTAIDSRMRRSRVSGRLAVWIHTTKSRWYVGASA